MKRRKGSRAIPRLRRDASDAEIIRWVGKSDVFARIDAGVTEVVRDRTDLEQVLEQAVFQGNLAQLNVRIPKGMKTVLTRLARERTTDVTTLARIWLAERIQRELRDRAS